VTREPLCVRFKVACELTGVPAATLRKAIRVGLLEARTIGGVELVNFASLRRLVTPPVGCATIDPLAPNESAAETGR
jgi:hypothetical protein